MNRPATYRVAFADGAELVVTDAVNDGGWSGGHTTSQAWERTTTPPRLSPRICVRRGSDEIDVDAWPAEPANVDWEIPGPPLPTAGGMLLRRARLTHDGRRTEREVQPAILIRSDGSATVVGVVLDVAPLCELPDGRLLLPGADPLWRDSFSEPLSALTLDGATEPLRVGGDELTPPRLVSELAPEWLPGGDADPDVFPFETESAWLDAAAETLTLRLAALCDPSDVADGGKRRWLMATVRLGDGGDITLIDRGTSRGLPSR